MGGLQHAVARHSVASFGTHPGRHLPDAVNRVSWRVCGCSVSNVGRNGAMRN